MNRFAAYAACILLAILSLAGLAFSTWSTLPLAFFGALTALRTHDMLQVRHSILRNYPVLGHMRFLFEGVRPEIRQYLIENDEDE